MVGKALLLREAFTTACGNLDEQLSMVCGPCPYEVEFNFPDATWHGMAATRLLVILYACIPTHGLDCFMQTNVRFKVCYP